MEKHKCKLCFKSYDNGRALGGHMRSHMMNLPIPPSQLRNEDAESASSASSSEEDEEQQQQQQQQRQHFEEEEEEDDDKAGLLLSYGLRENPRKSFRLADPEFSFTVDAASSVVLQDRESETESSKNPTRRRSKRTRKLNFPNHHHQYHYHHHHRQEEDEATKKLKCSNKLVQATESWAVEPEPVSSVSNATTEEDVAFCLMMLSRDKWINKKEIGKHQQEEEYEEDEDEEYEMREAIEKSVENSYESEEIKLCKTTRSRVGGGGGGGGGKYKCETCNKVFKSYQALGGHRASHKKIRAAQMVSATRETESMELENVASTSMAVLTDRKIHECPVCFRVFSSGQALGGHKRSHVMNSAATTRTSTILKNSTKNAEILIDLNLPAPIEDDEQFELSAVSDAEFVNHANR